MAVPKKAAAAIEVRLAGRNFTLTCAPEEESALREAIEFLDTKIGEVQAGAKSATPERLLVLAGLNLAHEVLLARNMLGRVEGLDTQEQALLDLARRIDKVAQTL